MIFKEVLLFMSGAAIGAVLGGKWVERKFNAEFEEEVNKRIDSIMEEERVKEKQKKVPTEKKKIQYNNLARKEEEDIETMHKMAAEYEHPEDDMEIADHPYIVEEEDFDNDTTGYDHSSLYFYKGNGVLVDDEDNIVEDDDAKHMLGDDWRALTDGISVHYIRNESLKTDYELVVNLGSYPLE